MPLFVAEITEITDEFDDSASSIVALIDAVSRAEAEKNARSAGYMHFHRKCSAKVLPVEQRGHGVLLMRDIGTAGKPEIAWMDHPY